MAAIIKNVTVMLSTFEHKSNLHEGVTDTGYLIVGPYGSAIVITYDDELQRWEAHQAGQEFKPFDHLDNALNYAINKVGA